MNSLLHGKRAKCKAWRPSARTSPQAPWVSHVQQRQGIAHWQPCRTHAPAKEPKRDGEAVHSHAAASLADSHAKAELVVLAPVVYLGAQHKVDAHVDALLQVGRHLHQTSINASHVELSTSMKLSSLHPLQRLQGPSSHK